MMKSDNHADDVKQQLKSLKKTIKEYEHNFLSSTGRKPGKADIAANPDMGNHSSVIIAMQYKIYNKLRKSVDLYDQADNLTSSNEGMIERMDSKAVEDEKVVSPTVRLETRRKSRIATGIMSNEMQNIMPITTKKALKNVKVEEFATFNDAIQDLNPSPASAGYQDFISKKKEIEDLKSPKKPSLKNIDIDIEVSPIVKASSVAESEKDGDRAILKPSGSKKEVRFDSSANKPSETVQTAVKAVTPTQRPPLITGWSGEIKKVEETVDHKVMENNPVSASRSKKSKPPKEPIKTAETATDQEASEFSQNIGKEIERETVELKGIFVIKAKTEPINEDHKSLPELPPKVVSQNPDITLEKEKSLPDVFENPELPALPPRNSSNEMIKHIPTDIMDPTEDKDPAQNIAEIASSSIKPILNLESVFYRLPKDQVLRCRIYRRSALLDKAYPTFYLHNDIDNMFILSARKRKKAALTTYVISDSIEETTKNSSHYLGRLKGNFGRNSFILCDARGYIASNPDAPLKELACVQYHKNVLPRVLSVAIPNSSLPENEGAYEPLDVLSDMRTRDTERWTHLRNKNPRWNENTQSHCLNFGGRVTQPSVKNLQLISCENDDGFIYMQFGRCGPDEFSLDVRWPMTALEAFAIAISTFEAYDGQ